MGKIKILIVEDELVVAQDLKNSLEGLGYKVSAIEDSGEEAIKRAEELVPDLILMDIMLHGEIDGIETAHRIRSGSYVPIIYLTALTDKKILERAKVTEPFGYLIKPFEETALRSTIEMALYKHKMEKKLRKLLEERAHELKLATVQLEKQAKKYHALLENASDAIILINKRGYLFEANKKTRDITGYSKSELMKMRYLQLVPEHEKKRARDFFSNVIEIGMGEINDIEMLKKDGRIVPVDITGNIIEYSGEKIFQGIFRDISYHKKMEEEIRKGQRLEPLGALAGGIAHDFNNILTGFLSKVTLAKWFIDDKALVLQKLEEAEKVLSQAKNLAGQLTTFSKGGAPIKKVCPVKELLKETAEFVLAGSNVKYQCDISDDLRLVEIDKGQISQVVTNFLLNAKEAMPNGGEIEILAENCVLENKGISSLPQGKYIKITFKDYGVGIPPKILPKIFDLYFTTKKKGSGLGLATSYSIVKKHGGRIDVKSHLDVGSTFTVYLPASKKSPAFLYEEKKTDMNFVTNKKFLFLEDEKDIREDITTLLESKGNLVKAVETGMEAIVTYENALNMGDPFDLVIMDLTVPGGMGGKQIIKKLLEVDPKIKAIVASGYSDDPIVSNPGNYGFCGVIPKPYKIEELNKVLLSALGAPNS